MGVILNAAWAAARDDVLSVRDVGRLLSGALEDGKIDHAERKDLEKVRSELVDELSPAARNALNRFLGMGDTFDGNLAGKIFGMTVQDADKLEKAGVTRLSELMISSRTPAGRDKLAVDSKVNLAKVTAFAERADLARLVGVGNKYSALLHGVGINNMGELAEQNPAALRRQILDFIKTDDGQAITNRRPGLKTVEKWIDRATMLPEMLKYVGDQGPNFTKEAFDSLNDFQKGMLIFGTDVRVSDGSTFEADNLRVTVPRRKPRSITEFIKDKERTAFGGDYESVHLSSIERIKADDDTLGYRLSFDVAGVDDLDYEGGSTGDVGMEGWVMVAMDAEGKVLSTDAEVWPNGDYEG